MTQVERAAALGISDRQLRKDEAAGCPRDLAGAIAWRAENRNNPDAKPSLNDETSRLRSAQADLAELEAAEKRGELCSVEDAQIAANEALVIVATQLEALPGRLAAQLAGMTDAAEIRALLLHEVRSIRSAAAARIEEWARLAERGAAPEAAAGSNSGPVGGSVSGASTGEPGAGAVALQ